MTDRRGADRPVEAADPGVTDDADGEATEGDADRVTRRRLLRAAGAAGTALLAGCTSNPWEPGGNSDGTAPSSDSTGGDGGASTGDDGSTSGDGSSDEDDDSAGGDDDSTGGDEDAPDPDLVVEVAPDDFTFEPDGFEIDAGETVRWVWMDGGHNLRVRSEPDGSSWEGTPGSASDTYPEGYEHQHTFEVAGEYEYFCAPHQSLGLEGTFTVREG